MKRKIALQPRRAPKQARSVLMKEDILKGAIRVLEKYGAHRFTTIRVAEQAGVSVGSLYQYFPNKESLLFALHEQEMTRTWFVIRSALLHDQWSPREKVRCIARHFFEVEAQEPAQLRILLEEVQSYFRNTQEHRALMAEVSSAFQEFLSHVMPKGRDIGFAANLLMTTIESMGKSIASREYSRLEGRKWSDACADMLNDYLELS